jgi:hypothetical protein
MSLLSKPGLDGGESRVSGSADERVLERWRRTEAAGSTVE